MEAWNVYLSIRVDHAPTRAAELVVYQCIITSVSTQYPPTAWLNYDVQFCTLIASDPNLHWDVRYTDLWLQCMTARSTQSTRWPCTHCGTTNHYPDHCPFRPNPSPAITGGQQVTTRGQPSSRSNFTTRSSLSNPVTCRDFNRSFCCRPECKYSHCCEYCGANHPVRNCFSQGWPQPTC